MNQGKRTIRETIALVTVILFVILLPYDMLYSTIAIYPMALAGLFSLSRQRLRSIPPQAWIFCIIFLLSASGYWYTTDLGKAGYLLERQLMILIFPFLLPLLIELNGRNIRLILHWFTLSCLAASAYLFFLCFQHLYIHGLPLSTLAESRFYNHNFSLPIHIHAGFLSLYFSLAICFLMCEIPSAPKLQKLLCGSGIFLLSAALYFLASRNTIIALLLVILFIFPFFMVKKKALAIFVSLVLTSAFLFLGIKSSYIHQRFSKELLGDIQISQSNAKDYPESRIVRWQCAADIIERKPLFGHGTGDEIPLLQKEYQKKKMWVSYFEEFNTHNQYLAIVIKHGFAGLFVFLLMLSYFFYLAVKRGSFIYFSFLFILTIGLITENIIDANKGIFFFAFFNTLFGYEALKTLRERRAQKNMHKL